LHQSPMVTLRAVHTLLGLILTGALGCGEGSAPENGTGAGAGGGGADAGGGQATTSGGTAGAGTTSSAGVTSGAGAGGRAGVAGAGAGGRAEMAGAGGRSEMAGAGTGGRAAQGGFPGIELPAGKGWLELPDTALDPVCACHDGFPEVCASGGCGGIFAWSSGAYDSLRARLIVFGGGHSDYFGNELFGLSLSNSTMSRLTDPGLPLADECTFSTAGGTQPASRHTYDTLLYLEHADRLFVFGGSMPPCGYLSQDTWTYSFADQAWEPHQPSGPIPEAVPGITGDYDPVSKRVLLHDNAALYRYDLEQDAFEQLLAEDEIDYHMSGVIEPQARKLVLVGTGNVLVYDIDGDDHSRKPLDTTGADELVGSVYPGLAYDPDSGHIVAWNGGDTAYSLDLDTGIWTALTSPNGPGVANETGTFKRWRYVGDSSFVLVNGPRQNAFLFRL
jgi:hypothetical protein